MAIFNKSTQFVNKYFEEYMEAIKAIPEDQAEEQFKKVFGFYANYSELKYEEKCHMAKLHFQKFIEVILDRHQDYKTCNLISSEEIIEKELQAILKPLREKNVFFYSKQCNSKLPGDIIKKLEREAAIMGEIMSDMNYEQALREVRNDMEAENKKWRTIDGYGVLKQLLDVLPHNFMDKVSVEGNVLYFDNHSIDVISNIDSVGIFESDSLINFDKTVIIERSEHEDTSIVFKHGKNTESGEWGYVKYEYNIGW